ncbi:LCP family protein [Georgenia sp. SYP-B2076]|uniref:LCP family protein n=1 Tax=Georgenia sp. SYP-B2076 TaxID=2495881 RepID=UPI000F8DC60A|nr:LCP family protein [Georgenia sp. SYP-B2076]
MGEDKRNALPPSFTPDGGSRRPDPRSARPVGAGQERPAPAHPRRLVRPGTAPATPSAARQPPASGGGVPPSYAPAGQLRRTPPAGGATQVQAGRLAAGPRAAAPTTATPLARPARARRRRRPITVILTVLLIAAIAWPAGLLIWANGKINHTDALSGAPNTAGTTYLIAGSDSRADGTIPDGTQGQRSDSIMVLQKPRSGPASLISLPRDTFVEIPGYGMNKLNASYSLGGAPLLVETVEKLTGLTVDHYVQIGMGGVQQVVDAVGGVELCLDRNVEDPLSNLYWTAGCHVADGATALAFARNRHGDPMGDLGRAERQRQVVGAVVKKVATPVTLVDPARQLALVDAGTAALTVDEDSNILDLGRLALAFRAATGPDGIVGAPPIASLDYRPGGIGSAVLLDENKAPDFFTRMRDGRLTPADVAAP